MARSSSVSEEHRRQERERLRTLLRGIARQETAKLHSGASTWSWWLEVAARHGRYGFDNTLLINAQRPAATEVRSYEEWKARGRQVRKGETGIRILSLRSNPRSVFDLSQTDGSTADPPEAVTPAQAWELLRRLAVSQGLQVDRGSRWPYIGPPGRLLKIPADLDDGAAAALLAHQLGHLQLHGGRHDGLDGDPAACHGVRRVEADSVAHLLLAPLGLESAGMDFPAVARWAGTDVRTNPLTAIRTVGDRVLRTATQLRRRLDDLPNVGSSARARTVSAARQSSETSPTRVSRDELTAVHHAAQRFFLSQCPGSWVPAYLNDRGFGADIQRRWEIGYAPKSWRNLTDHLRRLGHSDETILVCGLARRRRRDGGLYDTFRDRAMFAIRDPEGSIAGFIGRLPTGGEGPKYLNSPETPLFRKGELLFGLHEVRDRLTAGARPVLVEGPLDAIAVNAAASRRYAAVAPSGTALTRKQLEALGRLVDLRRTGLIIALDGDPAGQVAVERAWPVLAEVPGPVDIATLPSGQDPAGLLRHHGPAAVHEALERTVALPDFVLNTTIERVGGALESPEDRMAAVRAAAGVIARLPPRQVAHQVARVAQRLGVEPAIVTDALTTAVTSPASRAVDLARQDFPHPPRPSAPTDHSPAPTRPTRPRPHHTKHL